MIEYDMYMCRFKLVPLMGEDEFEPRPKKRDSGTFWGAFRKIPMRTPIIFIIHGTSFTQFD